MKQLLSHVKYAVLVAAGAFITQLEADGFADEFGGWAFVATGILGIVSEVIDKEEAKGDG